MNNEHNNQIILHTIHKHSLDILTEIVKLCEKHSISYVSLAGTTLGAIRHNGFIPWDDDIDLGMPRIEYERFLQIAKKELPSHLSLHNYPINKDFVTYFSKVCDNRTTFIDDENKNLRDYPHHIWVDIFPIDKICVDRNMQSSHLKRVNRLYEICKCKTLLTVSKISTLKNRLIGTILRPIIHISLLPISKEKIYSRLAKIIQQYNNEDSPFVAMFIDGGVENVCEYNDLFPGIKHKFEKIYINIPVHYDKILKNTYGDYMRLPPSNKRYGHRPICVKGIK